MKNFLVMLSIIITFSCGDDDERGCHSSVDLYNISNKTIYFGGRSASGAISYNPLVAGDYYRIVPGGTIKDIDGSERGCYEDDFSENSNRLYYIFFDEEVLLNNSWEDIVANDMVLKRYDLTLQEIQTANWTIIYSEN